MLQSLSMMAGASAPVPLAARSWMADARIDSRLRREMARRQDGERIPVAIWVRETAHGSLQRAKERVRETIAAAQHDPLDGEPILFVQLTSCEIQALLPLDEVVARSRDSLLAAGRVEGGSDPIVEARRDRDLGVIKSTMERHIEALERLERQPR